MINANPLRDVQDVMPCGTCSRCGGELYSGDGGDICSMCKEDIKHNSLITVTQLPVIEERLRVIADEIDKKTEEAAALVCTEDTVKAVKAIRSANNNRFSELEEQRKEVKRAVLSPYEAFERVYKECVTDKFRASDSILKDKISSVETELKAKKQEDVERFFNEYAESLHIDFVPFSRSGVNVTLSASLKSLKDSARTFLDRIADDLLILDDNPDRDEIMVEYRKSLSAGDAMRTVSNRHKALAAEQERKAQRESQLAAEREAAFRSDIFRVAASSAFSPPTESFSAPNVAQETPLEEILSCSFTAYASKDKLRKLKDFMEKEGIRYE